MIAKQSMEITMDPPRPTWILFLVPGMIDREVLVPGFVIVVPAPSLIHFRDGAREGRSSMMSFVFLSDYRSVCRWRSAGRSKSPNKRRYIFSKSICWGNMGRRGSSGRGCGRIEEILVKK